MFERIPGERLADCLKVELGLARRLRLLYALPSARVFDWPYVGIAWLALLAACPLLTLVGLFTLRCVSTTVRQPLLAFSESPRPPRPARAAWS